MSAPRRTTRRRTPAAPLSQQPAILHAASIERMEEAESMLENRSWAMSVYLAGLGVESLLQAFAMRSGHAHDARHDLHVWLSRCPRRVVDSIKTHAAAEWSLLNTRWDNSIRYLSAGGLLGRLRDGGYSRGISGGSESILRVNARRCVDAARVVHNKGLVQWSAS